MVFTGYDWPNDAPPGLNDPCPADRPRNRFSAQVIYADAAVVIAPWDWPEQSMDGVIELVRALVRALARR